VVLTAWGSDILVTPRAPGWRGAAMKAVVGWSLRQASLITADSQDVLAEIGRYRVNARCEEVFWGADTEQFKPGTPASGFEVVSLRNWEPNYNIDTLLRAWALFSADRPAAGRLLHLLGGGPQEQALRRLANELGIEHSVRFAGRLDDVGMVRALQRARASVSVPTSDATSVSVLESMACGLPVVVSDLPANRQWVDASGGLIVAPRDERALAAALSRLHDNLSDAAAMGARNRRYVSEYASRRSQFDRMAVLYETTHSAHPSRP
jgi:glycosyltransferase involved in cell wall biosynthesis